MKKLQSQCGRNYQIIEYKQKILHWNKSISMQATNSLAVGSLPLIFCFLAPYLSFLSPLSVVFHVPFLLPCPFLICCSLALYLLLARPFLNCCFLAPSLPVALLLLTYCSLAPSLIAVP